MSCMPDMMPTSLVATVVSRTCKFIKNGLGVFEIFLKICKMVCYALYLCNEVQMDRALSFKFSLSMASYRFPPPIWG